MRLPQVQQHVPLCRAKLYEMMGRGEFPQSVNLGPRAVAWIAAEVLEWVEDRIAQRTGEHAQ
ncbi:MAG: AlpA family phage regulatory protein [Halioglobus sp.]